MFETLVSSKTRRLLFEYLLTHPDHRFYLRGLSRELDVATSPLRRELKRLEQLGVLRAYQEANALFYVVDQTSPLFTQLKSAMGGSDLHPPVALSSIPAAEERPGMSAIIQPTTTASTEMLRTVAGRSSEVAPESIEGRVERVERRPRIPRVLKKSSWRWPVMVGGLSLGMLVMVVIGGMVYLGLTNQRLLFITSKAMAAPRSQVTLVEPIEPKPTREMRGSRWHMTPGALGGFSQGGVSDESY
ncbi:MAG: winged helix-turn-helix transcriptional regulator [Candidatus Omnitrophica bacterium]|nr:winged helix-turn-helix transcriptional regulator [Candidatus Omnitrophota bacterium]